MEGRGILNRFLIPLFVALLIASSAAPLISWLRRLGLSPLLSAWVALLMALLVLGGLVAVVILTVRAQWEELSSAAAAGYDELRRFAANLPGPLAEVDWDAVRDHATEVVMTPRFGVGAISGVTTVVNVLTGDGATGAALVDHPGVAKIAFTGSTAVGREIGAAAGRSLKRVTLELGGKSANVILPDADLDAAVKGSFQGIYYNTGQACNAASRLFVAADRFDEVVSRLAESAGRARVGAGLAEGTQLGPLISAEQEERVRDFTRRRQGDGESRTRLASSTLLSRPSAWSSRRIARSRRSRPGTALSGMMHSLIGYPWQHMPNYIE